MAKGEVPGKVRLSDVNVSRYKLEKKCFLSWKNKRNIKPNQTNPQLVHNLFRFLSLLLSASAAFKN